MISTSRFALTAAAVAVSVTTACSGGGSHASTPSTATNTSAPGTFRPTNQPGVSGLIAEIDGNTLQVQNQTTGQVAVTLTTKTTYTQTVAATLSAVKVGSCVVATAPRSTASSSATPAPTSSPSTGPRSITAGTVMVTEATNGSCTRGFAGGGTRPSGFPTDAPSGFPSNRPSGAPTGSRGTFGGIADIVAGKVTAVSGSTITVQADNRTPGSTSSSTVQDTVTVTASTKYTATVSATRAAVKVGRCADAMGTTESDGSLTAARLALSSPESDGTCASTQRFGRFGGGGAGNGGN